MTPEFLKSLGMSTSWNGASHNDGCTIVDRITGLGFRRIEVEYRVSEQAIPGIEGAVRAGNIEVCSIHNFAPRPSAEAPTSRGGDKLSLASPDETERREAVRLTLRSVELARRLGAKAVVLHMGEVDTGRGYFKELADIVESRGFMSGEAIRLRRHVVQARSRRRAPFLEAALSSLRDLEEPAGRAGITLCVKNRYYYHQIPLPGEVIQIKRLLPTPWICYWHDVGHAHVQDVLGFESHVRTIEMLRPYMFGAHIHDSKFIRDHKAPGTGEIDFAHILNLIPGTAIKVLELAPTVEEAEIRQARDHLASLHLVL